MTSRRLAWCLAVCLLLTGTACAETIFEDRFERLDRWELADKGGASTMSLEADGTVPEPYGPTVLSLRGDHAMALVRDLVVTDCTITALWRDIDPDDYDSDGVIAARAMQPPELQSSPLADAGEGLYWVEHDSDEGFQIKVRDADANEETLGSVGDRALTNDATWNRTGWIWQKLRIEGSGLWAKFWPIHEPEPDEWQIHAVHEMFSEGRVGLRAWSGQAHVAYFSITSGPDRTDRIPFYAGLDRVTVFDDETVVVRLYTNLEREIDEVSVTFWLDDTDPRSVKRLPVPQGPDETAFFWDIAGGQKNAPQALALGPAERSGTYPLHVSVEAERSDKTLYAAVREVRVVAREDVSRRIAQLRDRARAIADRSLEGGVVHDVVIGLIELAESHYARGVFEKGDRPLKYAAEALDSFHERRRIPCFGNF